MATKFRMISDDPEDYMKNIKEGTPQHRMLTKEIKHKPNFDIEIAK